MALDAKTDIRSFLLTLPALTAIVGSRIRPDQRDESDGDQPAVIIEIADGQQFNDLQANGGLVQLDVIFRCLSHDVTESEAIGEAIRTNNTNPGTGLDGYEGIAGLGYIQSANRQSFNSDAVFDEEGQPTGEHEHSAFYSIWHQTLF